jgi:DNA polymerase
MKREERMKLLMELHGEITQCKKCILSSSRLNPVPGEGPLDPPLMFIGEAPGAKEDETGRPFIGQSGKLLTKMIEEIGLSRQEVFITSILKSRPPNNRKPKSGEVKVCRPYLERQIEILRPKIIVLLGGVAITSLIGPHKVTEAHGKFYEVDDIRFFMTFHPAAAMRFPKTKGLMRADFAILKQELGI